MAESYRGLTIRIGGDTTKLSKALRSANQAISGTQTELRKLGTALRLDPGNIEAYNLQMGYMANQATNTAMKLSSLKRAAEQVGKIEYEMPDGSVKTIEEIAKATEQFGGAVENVNLQLSMNQAELRAVTERLAETHNNMSGLVKQASKVAKTKIRNAFDLAAGITSAEKLEEKYREALPGGMKRSEEQVQELLSYVTRLSSALDFKTGTIDTKALKETLSELSSSVGISGDVIGGLVSGVEEFMDKNGAAFAQAAREVDEYRKRVEETQARLAKLREEEAALPKEPESNAQQKVSEAVEETTELIREEAEAEKAHADAIGAAEKAQDAVTEAKEEGIRAAERMVELEREHVESVREAIESNEQLERSIEGVRQAMDDNAGDSALADEAAKATEAHAAAVEESKAAELRRQEAVKASEDAQARLREATDAATKADERKREAEDELAESGERLNELLERQIELHHKLDDARDDYETDQSEHDDYARRLKDNIEEEVEAILEDTGTMMESAERDVFQVVKDINKEQILQGAKDLKEALDEQKELIDKAISENKAASDRLFDEKIDAINAGDLDLSRSLGEQLDSLYDRARKLSDAEDRLWVGGAFGEFNVVPVKEAEDSLDAIDRVREALENLVAVSGTDSGIIHDLAKELQDALDIDDSKLDYKGRLGIVGAIEAEIVEAKDLLVAYRKWLKKVRKDFVKDAKVWSVENHEQDDFLGLGQYYSSKSWFDKSRDATLKPIENLIKQLETEKETFKRIDGMLHGWFEQEEYPYHDEELSKAYGDGEFDKLRLKSTPLFDLQSAINDELEKTIRLRDEECARLGLTVDEARKLYESQKEYEDEVDDRDPSRIISLDNGVKYLKAASGVADLNGGKLYREALARNAAQYAEEQKLIEDEREKATENANSLIEESYEKVEESKRSYEQASREVAEADKASAAAEAEYAERKVVAEQAAAEASEAAATRAQAEKAAQQATAEAEEAAADAAMKKEQERLAAQEATAKAEEAAAAEARRRAADERTREEARVQIVEDANSRIAESNKELVAESANAEERSAGATVQAEHEKADAIADAQKTSNDAADDRKRKLKEIEEAEEEAKKAEEELAAAIAKQDELAKKLSKEFAALGNVGRLTPEVFKNAKGNTDVKHMDDVLRNIAADLGLGSDEVDEFVAKTAALRDEFIAADDEQKKLLQISQYQDLISEIVKTKASVKSLAQTMADMKLPSNLMRQMFELTESGKVLETAYKTFSSTGNSLLGMFNADPKDADLITQAMNSLSAAEIAVRERAANANEQLSKFDATQIERVTDATKSSAMQLLEASKAAAEAKERYSVLMGQLKDNEDLQKRLSQEPAGIETSEDASDEWDRREEERKRQLAELAEEHAKLAAQARIANEEQNKAFKARDAAKMREEYEAAAASAAQWAAEVRKASKATEEAARQKVAFELTGDVTSIDEFGAQFETAMNRSKVFSSAFSFNPDNLDVLTANTRALSAASEASANRIAEIQRVLDGLDASSIGRVLSRFSSVETAVEETTKATRKAEAEFNNAFKTLSVMLEGTPWEGMVDDVMAAGEAMNSILHPAVVAQRDRVVELQKEWDECKAAMRDAMSASLVDMYRGKLLDAQESVRSLSEEMRKGMVFDLVGDTSEIDAVEAELADAVKSAKALSDALKLDPKNTEVAAAKATALKEAENLAAKASEKLNAVLGKLDASKVDAMVSKYGSVSEAVRKTTKEAQKCEQSYRQAFGKLSEMLKGTEWEGEARKIIDTSNVLDMKLTPEIVEARNEVLKMAASWDEAKMAMRNATEAEQVEQYRQRIAGLTSTINSGGMSNDDAAFQQVLGRVTQYAREAVQRMTEAANTIDASYRDMRKTVQGTEEDFVNLRRQAMEFSQTHAVSSDTILEIESLGGQLGIGIERLQAFGEVIANLEIATDMTADDLAVKMGQLQNVMSDFSDSEFENAADAIVRLGNNMATQESNIVAVAQRMSSVANITKMTTPELLAWSSAIASTGQRSEAAATAISNTITGISAAVANGGSDLQGFASIAKMSADEFTAAWETSPSNVLKQFIMGLESLSDSNTAAVSALESVGISAVRQENALLGLASTIDTIDDALTMSQDAWDGLSDEWGSAGDAANEAANKSEGFSGALAILQNNASNLAASLGDGLIPYMKVLSDMMNIVTDVLDSLPGPLKTVIVSVGGLAAGFALLAPVIDQLKKGFLSLQASAGATLFSVDGVTGAVTKLGVAGVTTGAALKTMFVGVGIALLVAEMAKLAEHAEEAAEHEENLNVATQSLAESTKGLTDAYEETSQSLNKTVETYGLIGKELDELIKKHADLNREMREGWEEVGKNEAVLDHYAESIYSIADNGDLTKEELAELNNAVAGFNKITGASVSVLDEHAGKLSLNADEIRDLVSAYKDEEEAARAAEDYEKAIEKQAEAEKAYADAYKQRQKIIDEHGADNMAFADELEEAERLRDAANKAVVDAGEAIGKFGYEFQTLNGLLEKMGVRSKLTEDQIKTLAAAFDDGANTVSKMEKAMEGLGIDADAGSVLKAPSDEEVAAFKKAQEKTYEDEKRIRDKYYKNRQKELDEVYKQEQRARDADYKAVQKQYDAEYKLVQKQYDKVYKARQKELDNEYKAVQKELDNVYKARQKELDNEYKAAQKASQNYLKQFKKDQEEQVKAFKAATDSRVEEIDREYDAKKKLLDAEYEGYDSDIDDRIKAIEAEQDAEDKALKQKERQEKLAELGKAVETAKGTKKREEAEKALQDYKDELAREDIKEQRQAQIEKLNDQKDALKEQLSDREEHLKNTYDAVKEEYKAERDAQLELIQEANEAEYEAQQELESAKLEAIKEAHSAELEDLKEQQSAYLEVIKENQSAVLETLKEEQSTELENYKQLQSDQLEAFKLRQSDELEAIKQTHSDELELLKQFHSEELTEIKNQQEAELAAYKKGGQAAVDALRAAGEEAGKQMDEGVASGINENAAVPAMAAGNAKSGMMGAFSGSDVEGKGVSIGIMRSLTTGINEGTPGLAAAAGNAKSGMMGSFTVDENEAKGLTFNLTDGVAKGITENGEAPKSAADLLMIDILAPFKGMKSGASAPIIEWMTEMAASIGANSSAPVAAAGESADKILAEFDPKDDKLSNVAGKWMASIATGMTNNVEKPLANARKIGESLAKPMDISKATESYGSNAAASFNNGFMRNAQQALQNAQSWAVNLAKSVKDALGIHSPSRVFGWIAQMIFAGFNKDWRLGENGTLEMVRGTAGDIEGAFGDNVGAFDVSMMDEDALLSQMERMQEIVDQGLDNMFVSTREHLLKQSAMMREILEEGFGTGWSLDSAFEAIDKIDAGELKRQKTIAASSTTSNDNRQFSITISIPEVVVREQADIDRLSQQIALRVQRSLNARIG